MTLPMTQDKVWVDKNKYDEAECQYYEKLAKLVHNGINAPNKSCRIVSPNKNKGLPKCDLVHQGNNKTSAIQLAEKTNHSINSSNKKETSVQPAVKLSYVNDVKNPVSIAPTCPQVIEKCLKPKDAKEKRNKADKKGRERKTPAKEETKGSPNTPLKLSLAGEVAKARQHIKDSLNCMDGVIAAISTNTNKELSSRIDVLNQTTGDIWKVVNVLCDNVATLEARVKQLESGKIGTAPSATTKSAAPSATTKSVTNDTENDDGVDLFGSDSEEESEDAKKVKEQRLAAYAAKKSKKPVLIAKSNIILDVKPWDDETDMKQMEVAVREVKCDGLLWGASKLVPLAYGIHKLQISCVVEDEKVSIDWLQETLEAIEDYVQSVDIAAFNKV